MRALLHLLFESLAYAAGFWLYNRQRRDTIDPLTHDQRTWVIVAAILGAAAGSKVLNWFSNPAELAARWYDPVFLMSGKTIVGGLIGGWIAVEYAKHRLGVTQRSGDLFAPALCLGIAVGRIGCFLGGLEDDTYGIATTLPWGIDFGDGIRRHPTQLYEIAFLLLLMMYLQWRRRMPHENGDLFKLFMVAYMAFRLLLDFFKPGYALLGLTAIQWACVGVLAFYSPEIPRLLRSREAVHG